MSFQRRSGLSGFLPLRSFQLRSSAVPTGSDLSAHVRQLKLAIIAATVRNRRDKLREAVAVFQSNCPCRLEHAGDKYQEPSHQTSVGAPRVLKSTQALDERFVLPPACTQPFTSKATVSPGVTAEPAALMRSETTCAIESVIRPFSCGLLSIILFPGHPKALLYWTSTSAQDQHRRLRTPVSVFRIDRSPILERASVGPCARRYPFVVHIDTQRRDRRLAMGCRAD